MKRSIYILTGLTVLAVVFYSFISGSSMTTRKHFRKSAPGVDVNKPEITKENSVKSMASPTTPPAGNTSNANTFNGSLLYRGTGSYVYKFHIDRAPESDKGVYLTYEYIGFEDPQSICRSINDNKAVGDTFSKRIPSGKNILSAYRQRTLSRVKI